MAEYIEREQTISAIMRDCPELVYYNKKEAIWCIECIPAVDVAPVVHGRWVNGCQCSVCGDRHGPYNSRHKPYYNYCPNCGAKMDGSSNG